MTSMSGLALLGARLDGVDPSPVVAGACLVAGTLFCLALHRRSPRHGSRLAMAGVAIAVAAAIYSHDVVNLPEIVAALVIGGSIGLLLARRCALAVLPRLVIVGQGLLGLAAMATGTAIVMNPGAFGLAGEGDGLVSGWCALPVFGAATGALLLARALWLALRRMPPGDTLLGVGTGLATAALGFTLGNSAMVMAGGLAVSAGLRLAWRARKAAPAASSPLPGGPTFP